jgi:hypothetical protein
VHFIKTATILGELVEPLTPCPYWPSTRPLVLSESEGSAKRFFVIVLAELTTRFGTNYVKLREQSLLPPGEG